MKRNYPNVTQSFAITGIVVLGMLLFSPLSLVLSKFMNKEASMLVYYLFATGIPFWLVNTIRKRKIGTNSFNFRIEKYRAIPLIMIATVALLFGIIMPIQNLIPIPESVKQLFMSFSNQTSIYSFILMVIAAPILEELLFRGIILDGLLKKYTPTKAILISSLLFGLVHLNPWQFVTGFVMGIFLGWVYYKSRSILLSIIIHASANLSAYLVRLFIDIPSNMNDSLELYNGTAMMIFVIWVAILTVLLCIYFLKKTFSSK